jgi:sortase A
VKIARALGALGRLMIRAGVLVLLLVVYQLWGTGIHTSEAQDNLRKQFEAEQQALAHPSTDPADGKTPSTTPIKVAADGSIPVPQPGQPIGRIDIPHIGSNFIMVEGVDLKYLSEGPGHFPGTPLPGQAGNAAVAGHRTTYKAPFNRIDELKPGDDIFVTTLQGKFTYQVMAQAPDHPGGPPLGHRIVKPNAVEILADKGRNQLTLMACNPKYYATQRIVVEALLVGNPAAGKPAEHPSNVNQNALAGLTKGDDSERAPAILWGLAALAVWFVTWWASQRLKRPRGSGAERLIRWTPYLIGVPVFLVLLYASFEAFSKVLPGAF